MCLICKDYKLKSMTPTQAREFGYAWSREDTTIQDEYEAAKDWQADIDRDDERLGE